jgi:hypothetical protein
VKSFGAFERGLVTALTAGFATQEGDLPTISFTPGLNYH